MADGRSPSRDRRTREGNPATDDTGLVRVATFSGGRARTPHDGKVRVVKENLHVAPLVGAPCVRPVGAVRMTAGHSALRESGLGQEPDEHLACAMQHKVALLLRCPGRNEPHVWPGNRLADGLGVSGIVLISVDVWLPHRPQASGVTRACRHNRACARHPAKALRPKTRYVLDLNRSWTHCLPSSIGRLGPEGVTTRCLGSPRKQVCVYPS
jgi:hypothetical protein